MFIPAGRQQRAYFDRDARTRSMLQIAASQNALDGRRVISQVDAASGDVSQRPHVLAFDDYLPSTADAEVENHRRLDKHVTVRLGEVPDGAELDFASTAPRHSRVRR